MNSEVPLGLNRFFNIIFYQIIGESLVGLHCCNVKSATSKDFDALNVREAVYDAVETHGKPTHSNAGFTKAYGLNP